MCSLTGTACVSLGQGLMLSCPIRPFPSEIIPGFLLFPVSNTSTLSHTQLGSVPSLMFIKDRHVLFQSPRPAHAKIKSKAWDEDRTNLGHFQSSTLYRKPTHVTTHQLTSAYCCRVCLFYTRALKDKDFHTCCAAVYCNSRVLPETTKTLYLILTLFWI